MDKTDYRLMIDVCVGSYISKNNPDIFFLDDILHEMKIHFDEKTTSRLTFAIVDSIIDNGYHTADGQSFYTSQTSEKTWAFKD